MADSHDCENLKSKIIWALGEVENSDTIDPKLHSMLGFLLERLALADSIIGALPPEQLKTAMVAANAFESTPGNNTNRAGWTRKGSWWREEAAPPADDPAWSSAEAKRYPTVDEITRSNLPDPVKEYLLALVKAALDVPDWARP